MAQPAGTVDSYDMTASNREDLQDFIYNISPTETPFLTSINKMTAKATLHEWQTESLNAASGANARIEGDDAGTGVSVTATRVTNYTQISDKVVVVSGTQEVVDKAGKNSEMAYQTAAMIKELKRDMETIICGNQAAVAGDATTARKLRSLEAWYTTNVSRGTGGASGSTTLAATDATTGDLRAFTEDFLKDSLQDIWTNGGDPDLIMLGATNKRVASAFAGNATRQIEATGKKLVTSIDVYVSDWGSHRLVPNRFSRARTVHVLDTSMWGVGYLRPLKDYPLAKTGDSVKKQLLVEYTLCAKNQAASGVIADLTS